MACRVYLIQSGIVHAFCCSPGERGQSVLWGKGAVCKGLWEWKRITTLEVESCSEHICLRSQQR